MVASKNPFEVFGLSPEIVERLDEKELFSLIKVVYRTLQKIYHPDSCVAKSAKQVKQATARTVELNLAFEKLNLDKNSESFSSYHRQYTQRRSRNYRKKISKLKIDLQLVQQKQGNLADGYMLYLLRGLPWLSENGNEPVRSFMPLTNLKLGLNDVAINQNIRSVSWNLGSNYKEIIFDALGSMLYRPVGRSKPFPVNFIYLLGVVPTREIDLLPLLNRVPPREGFFKCPALDSRYGIDGAPLQVQNTISVDKFKQHCLPLLRPDLDERAYLFSVHRPVFEEEGCISLEGVIVNISKL